MELNVSFNQVLLNISGWSTARVCSLEQRGEMSLAWDRNSCEILRSLGLVPNFLTACRCCSSQPSGFDVKSQALKHLSLNVEGWLRCQ